MAELSEELKAEARDLCDTLERALEKWVAFKFTKTEHGYDIPIPSVDSVLNGIINFAGISSASFHGILIKMYKEAIETQGPIDAFNNRVVDEYAAQLKVCFLDNLEEVK